MAKIAFVGRPLVSDEQLERNRKYSHGLGLPEVGAGSVDPFLPLFLAVIGGSPSIENEGTKERLRRWDGELWAINSMVQWCRKNGMKATFYCIDPLVKADSGVCEGVEKAILADCCDPSLFDALGDKARLAKLGENAILHGTTAASSAPIIAAHEGYRHVTVFGCESSFVTTTHAHKDQAQNKIWVECGGEEYTTSPAFIMQAEFLSGIARELPNYIEIDGGGFLAALTRHGDYNVTHVSPPIMEAWTRAANVADGF